MIMVGLRQEQLELQPNVEEINGHTAGEFAERRQNRNTLVERIRRDITNATVSILH